MTVLETKLSAGGEDVSTSTPAGGAPMPPCVSCGAPAKLQCPKCLELKLPKDVSVFCTQECFKSAWGGHKKIHNPPPNTQLYCVKRGKARSDVMPSFNWTGDLRPYRITPKREVPASIPRPDYAIDPNGVPTEEVESRQQKSGAIRSAEEIAGIRAACQLGRHVLDLAHAAVKPGVTTEEIDRIVHEATVAAGAYPSPLNYYTFPKSVCTSVNEVVCHGIPDLREMQAGDIVNVDVSVFLNGWHGDLNETFVVGEVDEASRNLVKGTHDCMMKAISVCKPGVRFRDLGDVISRSVQPAGFQVVKTYCGHGIGDLFHCAPSIPHYSHNKAVGVMQVGHVFTIEPMVNAGTWRDKLWPDGWTAVTEDGKRSAQFEHTIVITKDGCEILTARTPTSPPLWWESKATAMSE